MDLEFAPLRVAFFEDADDHIENLESALAELADESTNEEAFATLFRTVHTLKGDANAVGFGGIAELMHQCENTLVPIREGSVAMSAAGVDTIGRVVGQLIELINLERQSGLQEEQTEVMSPESADFSSDAETLCDFISESNEHLDLAEGQLLVIEGDPENSEALNAIYRAFHSLKGLASFLGLEAMRTLGHRAESMLNLAREKRLTLEGEAFELALASVDGLRKQVALAEGWLTTGKLYVDPRFNDLMQELELMSEVESETDALADRDATTLAPADETADSTNMAAPAFRETTPNRTSFVSSQPRESIKVDRERLDHLINVIGELVIGQAMLQEEVCALSSADGYDLLSVSRLNKTVRDLQELSLSLRMVPLAPAFQKMARIVRDTARKLGKEIHFETEGEETELDKTVVDQIGDPLMHMVRNAVDHGIESPSERRAKGKPSHGTIWLRAYHQGGNIYVEIQDDGKGLDRQQLLDKAIERGVITSADQLGDDEVLDLIFAPGFTTAREVTDISGRGVGMDVVRRSVESLQGHVSIKSEENVGSTITIRLPLTLAILDGLSVRVGTEAYIVPILSVIESYSASAEQICDIGGKGEVVVVRGDIIPLLRLQDLLQSPTQEASSRQEHLLVVIVEDRSKRFALLVDELLGQSQVVIKNLETNYRKVDGVAGATILGDGRVAMILDICGLFSLSRRSSAGRANANLQPVVCTDTNGDPDRETKEHQHVPNRGSL